VTQMKIVDQLNLGWHLLRRASQPDCAQENSLQRHETRTTLRWEFGEHASERAAESNRESKQILLEMSARS